MTFKKNNPCVKINQPPIDSAANDFDYFVDQFVLRERKNIIPFWYMQRWFFCAFIHKVEDDKRCRIFNFELKWTFIWKPEAI